MSVTGQIIATIQAIDDTSGETIFNHGIPDAISTGLDTAGFHVAQAVGPGTYNLFNFGMWGFYVRNTGSLGFNLAWYSISLGIQENITMQPGMVVMFFEPTSDAQSVEALSINVVNGIASLEYAYWA